MSRSSPSPIEVAAAEKQWQQVSQIARTTPANTDRERTIYGGILFFAIAAAEGEAAENLIKADASLDVLTENKCNLLHLACLHNLPQLIPLLIARDSTLKTEQNANGLTPIEMAATNGQWHLVREIAKTEAIYEDHEDVEDDVIYESDATHYDRALLLAIAAAQTEAAEDLIMADADLNYCDENGNNPLHLACLHLPQLIPFLLKRAPFLNHRRNGDNLTPIEMAATNRQWDVVREIAKTPTTDDAARYGCALVLAIEAAETEVVVALINAGARLHWCRGKTNMLHLAHQHGLPPYVIRMLVERRPALSIGPDTNGRLLIEVAASNRDGAIVELLLPYYTGRNDNPPNTIQLLIGIFSKDEELIKETLATHRTSFSPRLIISLSRLNDPEITKLFISEYHFLTLAMDSLDLFTSLLQLGASPALKGKHTDKELLSYAFEKKNFKAAAVLLLFGASVLTEEIQTYFRQHITAVTDAMLKLAEESEAFTAKLREFVEKIEPVNGSVLFSIFHQWSFNLFNRDLQKLNSFYDRTRTATLLAGTCPESTTTYVDEKSGEQTKTPGKNDTQSTETKLTAAPLSPLLASVDAFLDGDPRFQYFLERRHHREKMGKWSVEMGSSLYPSLPPRERSNSVQLSPGATLLQTDPTLLETGPTQHVTPIPPPFSTQAVDLAGPTVQNSATQSVSVTSSTTASNATPQIATTILQTSASLFASSASSSSNDSTTLADREKVRALWGSPPETNSRSAPRVQMPSQEQSETIAELSS